MAFANVAFYKKGPVSPCSGMLCSAMLQVAFLSTEIIYYAISRASVTYFRRTIYTV
jgi:hypothetical protein